LPVVAPTVPVRAFGERTTELAAGVETTNGTLNVKPSAPPMTMLPVPADAPVVTVRPLVPNVDEPTVTVPGALLVAEKMVVPVWYARSVADVFVSIGSDVGTTVSGGAACTDTLNSVEPPSEDVSVTCCVPTVAPTGAQIVIAVRLVSVTLRLADV